MTAIYSHSTTPSEHPRIFNSSVTSFHSTATTSMSNTTALPLRQKCMQALLYSQDLKLNLGEILKCTLALTIIFLLLLVSLQYKQNKLAIHGNFFVLICNLILLYLIESFGILLLEMRCQILYRVQTDPCQLLTPPWLAAALMLHTYIYFVGYALTHFAISTERVKATFYSKNYEKEGLKYSYSCTFIVWFITIAINVIIIWMAFQDDDFSQPLVHITLTTKTNGSFLVNLQYLLLALIILTSFMDCFATFLNRKHKTRYDDPSKHSAIAWVESKQFCCERHENKRVCLINSLEITSDLSQKYQINENTLTMRLILPLDISFSIFFCLYLGINTRLRTIQDSMPSVEFAAWFKIIYSLLPLHSIVSILLYMRFVKVNKAKAFFKVEMDKQAKLYFEQLDTQWTCKS